MTGHMSLTLFLGFAVQCSIKMSVLGHLTYNKYRHQVHVLKLTRCCYTYSDLKTIMPKRCLKKVLQVFCGDICTKNAVKCRTVFLSKVTCAGESQAFRGNIESTNLQTICVSSDTYIHLCMYFLVYICLYPFTCIMSYGRISFTWFVSLFTYPWLYFWIHVWAMCLFYLLMWRVSKFAPPTSRQISDPPKFHQWSTALLLVLCLQSNDSFPWELGKILLPLQITSAVLPRESCECFWKRP